MIDEKWKKLLSPQRLGDDREQGLVRGRSPFQVDNDRIVFSSAFRRMQDKTQVFPLSESDYVRTRLTHSLEVASIAWSMGAGVGAVICERGDLGDYHPSDFGAIVATAALAHDIGNPPFGHSGEDAIRHWFVASPVASRVAGGLSEAQRRDFEAYEGNAEGFRILTRLQFPDNRGGMQLTCATLAAFTKYPVESTLGGKKGKASRKKFGFFQSEIGFFEEVAEATGLKREAAGCNAWTRHPLVFLVEAADDITYRVIDFEDGYRQGLLGLDEVIKRLRVLAGDAPEIDSRLATMGNPKGKVEFLRARALGMLVRQVVQAFLAKEREIVDGEFDQDLIKEIPGAGVLGEILGMTKERVYSARRVVEIEAAGFEVASGLLDCFLEAVNDVARHGDGASPRSRTLLKLMPDHVQWSAREWKDEAYRQLQVVTDFFCGMTDSFAVSLYQKVRGISLPSS
jgi:dGTPase